jgi:hypothetical protein
VEAAVPAEYFEEPAALEPFPEGGGANLSWSAYLVNAPVGALSIVRLEMDLVGLEPGTEFWPDRSDSADFGAVGSTTPMR